jgi:hypothetical protein
METSNVTQDQGPIADHMQPTGTIQLPAPTAWPMVLGVGIALMLAGLVTSLEISLLGLVMVVPAVVGWFVQVLPYRSNRLPNPALQRQTAHRKAPE